MTGCAALVPENPVKAGPGKLCGGLLNPFRKIGLGQGEENGRGMRMDPPRGRYQSRI